MKSARSPAAVQVASVGVGTKPACNRENRRPVYEVRGKLQTQILCGADDNPRRRMNTAR